MNITGVVPVVPQQSIWLISLEPDVEFLVLIPTVITVVHFADVIHDPRTPVEHEPLVAVRQHRSTRWRRCNSRVAELPNLIIIII